MFDTTVFPAAVIHFRASFKHFRSKHAKTMDTSTTLLATSLALLGGFAVLKANRRTHAVAPGLNPHVSVPHSESLELYHNVFSLVSLELVVSCLAVDAARGHFLDARDGVLPLLISVNRAAQCSGKVRICLAEKSVSFKSHHIDLIETGSYETLSPKFLQVNPAGTVPVLVSEGHPVYESHEQIRFIDQIVPKGSLSPPEGTEERKTMDYWVDKSTLVSDTLQQTLYQRAGSCVPGLTLPLFMTMILDIPSWKIAWGILFHPDRKRPLLFLSLKHRGLAMFAAGAQLARFVELSRKAMRGHLEEIEAWLATPLASGEKREFLAGTAFSLADVGFVTIFERLRVGHYQSLWADLPHVTAYWDRLRARPSYKVAVADVELECIRVGSERVAKLKAENPWLDDLLEVRTSTQAVNTSKL